MNRHPYLRAYMAGLLLPSWFLLLGVAGFLMTRRIHEIPDFVQRVMIFPMAVVPNLWGAWNLVYVALGLKRRVPLGIWGAGLPPIVVAAALVTLPMLEPNIIGLSDVLAVAPIAAPVGVGLYYLAWKHVVGFFNRVVGVE